jgi:hypothetical protein
MGINEARRVALRFCRRCTLEVGHAKVGREHTLSFAAFAISIGLVVKRGSR